MAGAGTELNEPPLPDDVDYRELDREVRDGLKSLPKGLAERVGRHLLMATRLLEEEPKRALEHASVARRLASRIAVVREATGLTAYLAGEWQIAISEMRTAQRLNGTQDYVAMIADCERALGRPERAVDAWREADASRLDDEVRVELLIVAAGARRDLGQESAAVGMLQVPELESATGEPWLARLRFAYADALAAVDRRDEAAVWFQRTLEVDEDGQTEATERLLELEGVVLPEIDEDEEPAAEADEDDAYTVTGDDAADGARTEVVAAEGSGTPVDAADDADAGAAEPPVPSGPPAVAFSGGVDVPEPAEEPERAPGEAAEAPGSSASGDPEDRPRER